MRDLAAAELHHRFHAIALSQEPDGVVLLELVVVIVRVRAKLQFLHLDHVLFFLGLVLLLLVLVLPLAIVHGLGHRRLGGGRDQDQVQTHVLRFAHGGQRGHDLDGSVRKYGAHFTHADGFIHIFPDPWTAGWVVSGWNH